MLASILFGRVFIHAVVMKLLATVNQMAKGLVMGSTD